MTTKGFTYEYDDSIYNIEDRKNTKGKPTGRLEILRYSNEAKEWWRIGIREADVVFTDIINNPDYADNLHGYCIQDLYTFSTYSDTYKYIRK